MYFRVTTRHYALLCVTLRYCALLGLFWTYAVHGALLSLGRYPSPARDVMASLPKVVKLAQSMGLHASVENTRWQTFFVRMPDNASDRDKGVVVAALRAAISDSPNAWTVTDNVQSAADTQARLH